MKKLSIIAAIAALAFLGTACTKNDPNGGNNSNFPEINTFVETYFSRTSIQKIETDNDEIEVKLADKTEIDFYLNYDWKKIDCEDSRVYGIVPAELVPTQITDYVTANYPNNHIDKIEKKQTARSNGWEIELDNDIEINFDNEFNVITNGGNNSDYPEIATFVETYFPQTTILRVETDCNEIEVKLTDRTEIDFTLNYEWKNIDCEDSQIYGSVPTELVPTQITDYVTANYPNNHIDKIEKHSHGWEIELDNDLEIEFDSEFNVINGGGNGGGNNSEYPEISTFVETYFPQTSILKVEADDHEIEVELADRTEIDFYLNYDWKMIDCEHSQVYGIVPAELVPTQITDYMTANYPNNHIDKIEKTHHGGWEIELDNGVEIEFDQDFNVIEVGHK
ncbi:MAG: PepSY-like domain-containing protein [Bacteroidales bacterium]|nr:PepSY-like domain-containing protein [Bacteroidales bacterium]